MDQPIPKVTMADVERIVKRDYPSECFDEVMRILDQYHSEYSKSGGARIKLAVLKLANGEFAKIQEYVDVAIIDFRDVLSLAEYPAYNHKTFMLPDAEQESIITKDWKQYQEWLTR